MAGSGGGQFLSSMALAKQEKGSILDVCVAPGSESFYIAALMKNTGSLFSNDANPDRAKAVVSNLHRMGVHNSVVSSYDGRVFPKISSKPDDVSCPILQVIFVPCGLLLSANAMLSASGQAFIYWSVKKNALRTSSTKVSKDITIARRLISVTVIDFICWFPIGMCGLLASISVPIHEEVNVALAIFVLPLNSALNPFMYTFNTVMEKRRKAKETKLLKWLEFHTDFIDS